MTVPKLIGLDAAVYTPHLFADLPPASAFPNLTVVITDSPSSVIGAVVSAGGGSNRVMLASDGIVWRVSSLLTTPAQIPYINVLDYNGADPTGNNDSTAAINAALVDGQSNNIPVVATGSFVTAGPTFPGFGVGHGGVTLKIAGRLILTSTFVIPSDFTVMGFSFDTPVQFGVGEIAYIEGFNIPGDNQPALRVTGLNRHYLANLSIHPNATSPGIVFDGTTIPPATGTGALGRMDNVQVRTGPSNPNPCLIIDSWFWFWAYRCRFLAGFGLEAVRITNTDPNAGGRSGIIYFDDFINSGGGITITSEVGTPGISIGNCSFKNGVVENMKAGAADFTLDGSGPGGWCTGILIENYGNADSKGGGGLLIKGRVDGVVLNGPNSLRNSIILDPATSGSLTSLSMDSCNVTEGGSVGGSFPSASTGFAEDLILGSLLGIGDTMSPAVHPLVPLQIVSDVSLWDDLASSQGQGVIVNYGLTAPDGTPTAAGVWNNAGGNRSLTLGSFNITPQIGDMVIVGGWQQNPNFGTKGIHPFAIGASFPNDPFFSFYGSISGSTLTVTSMNAGTITTGAGSSRIDTSSAAEIIQDTDHIVTQLSGTPGGIGTYGLGSLDTVASCTMIEDTNGFSVVASIDGFDVVGSISGTTLTVTAVNSGVINIPSLLLTASAPHVQSGTLITGQLTNIGPPGGLGTYSVDISQTVGSTDITSGTLTVTAVNSGTITPPADFFIDAQITGQLTGPPGGVGTYSINFSQTAASVAILGLVTVFYASCRIDGTTLTVSAVYFGSIVIGTPIVGDVVPGTTVTGQIDGTPNGVGTYTVDVSQTVPWTGLQGRTTSFSIIGSISGTTLTVTSVVSGTVAPGSISNVYIQPAGIVSQLSGTPGGVGTYMIDTPQTVPDGTRMSGIPSVQFDPAHADGGALVTTGTGNFGTGRGGLTGGWGVGGWIPCCSYATIVSVPEVSAASIPQTLNITLRTSNTGGAGGFFNTPVNYWEPFAYYVPVGSIPADEVVRITQSIRRGVLKASLGDVAMRDRHKLMLGGGGRINSAAGTPTRDLYAVSDRVFNTTAGADLVCTTAGGAFSTTRGNGTSYATGVWAAWSSGTTVVECTASGTTAGSPPSAPTSVGQTVTDGGVTWTCRALTRAAFINPNIGVAAGTSLAVTGALKSSGSAGVGYATGAGSTVTQLGDKSNPVTINNICGTITMNNSSLNGNSSVDFTVNNTTVEATDTVIVTTKSGATPGSYLIDVDAVTANAFTVHVRNIAGGNLSDAIVLNFAVIKSVAA